MNKFASSNVVFDAISPSEYSRSGWLAKYSNRIEILCWAFHRLSLFLYKTKEARFKIVPVTEACLAIYNNSGANSKPLKSEGFLIACNWTQKIRFRWLSRFLSTPEVMESQLTDTRRPHCLVTDVADRQKLLNCIVVLSALWIQKIAVTTNE